MTLAKIRRLVSWAFNLQITTIDGRRGIIVGYGWVLLLTFAVLYFCNK